MNAQRGDIWLVDFGEPMGREQTGRRPAIVVSADRLNDGPAGVVIVVPCTTTRRSLPTHIEIEADSTSGLDDVSYAKCEDVKSVSERRLITRLGVASVVERIEISRALRFLLEL